MDGKNTDYFSFSKLLESIDINLKDKEAVVLGTGGASRAVILVWLIKVVLLYML